MSAEPESTARKETRAKKRQAEQDVQASAPSNKSRKKRKTVQVPDDGEFDMELQIHNGIAQMDGTMLADYAARQLKRFRPDASVIELEDLRLPGRLSDVADISLQMQVADSHNYPMYRVRVHGYNAMAAAENNGKYACVSRALHTKVPQAAFKRRRGQRFSSHRCNLCRSNANGRRD